MTWLVEPLQHRHGGIDLRESNLQVVQSLRGVAAGGERVAITDADHKAQEERSWHARQCASGVDSRPAARSSSPAGRTTSRELTVPVRYRPSSRSAQTRQNTLIEYEVSTALDRHRQWLCAAPTDRIANQLCT